MYFRRESKIQKQEDKQELVKKRRASKARVWKQGAIEYAGSPTL